MRRSTATGAPVRVWHSWAFALAVLIVSTDVTARTDIPAISKKQDDGLQRVLVQDGSTVHNVGELQMHVGNWGIFGSRPGNGFTYSEAPSAQWPASSGVEYLFVAGLWVGAIRSGVPAVSTAAFEWEFAPGPDPLDTMYRSAEGAAHGNRLPSPNADDDGDGHADEDWLNGRDDDGDGLIDEDFAAISNQMFSCRYNDNTAVFPEHNPLSLYVRQESYQWEEDRFDDFVGINYWITNRGTNTLEDVYIGFFADCDIGERDGDNIYSDDLTAFIRVPVRCSDLGPVSMDIAYAYDDDGDNGKAPGYFGAMFLGHTVDPTGETAPKQVGISTYANFAGTQSYEQGGDPSNDFERYELLSSQNIERNAQVPRDYRHLICAGPFAELPPGSTLVFQTAFVIGNGLGGMLANAAAAKLTYEGAWFNLDGNRETGVSGRETPVVGPVDVVVDSCISPIPTTWNQRTAIYINNDCKQEELFRDACGYAPRDSARFMTGVAGNETQLHWIIGTAPPPPKLRLDDTDPNGVAIYWDNFSEAVPDIKTLQYDFEGYRIWRADNWHRPVGTSAKNGPPAELWKMLIEADLVNGFGEDSGLETFRYEPLLGHMTAARRADLVQTTVEFLNEFPTDQPPCNPGLTVEECDTVKALAMHELGLAGGRQYYRYVDRAVHRGLPTFYSVTASDHGINPETGAYFEGKAGDPSSNIRYIEPATPSQPAWAYDASEVYVVPNPATKQSLAATQLGPNNDDPTGLKIEFRNLPRDRGTIRVFTLSGDLVETLPFDGRTGVGTTKWDLVSRNGQDIASGVYLYSVETDYEKSFGRKLGKFVVIR